MLGRKLGKTVAVDKGIDRKPQKLRLIATLAKGTQAGQLTLCLVVKVVKKSQMAVAPTLRGMNVPPRPLPRQILKRPLTLGVFSQAGVEQWLRCRTTVIRS